MPIVKRALTITLFILSVPALCLPAAITANGTYEVGTTPGTLSSGQSTSGTYSFLYTFTDGDIYSVTGSYSASDTPTFDFSSTANYIGNTTNPAGASVGSDTLNVDLLQDFAYTGSSTTTGSASATLTQFDDAPGSYAEAEVFYDNQGLGMMGPYYGPGSEMVSSGPTTLNNLGDPVSGDFRYTFYFAAGTAAVPEPAEAGLLLLSLVALGAWRLYSVRKREASAAKIV